MGATPASPDQKGEAGLALTAWGFRPQRASTSPTSVRYAKVLWLHGQLESESEILSESRHILVGEDMGREVSVISMDILACEQTRFLQAESIESLGKFSESGELRFAPFLEGVGARELGELYHQLRQGVELSFANLRQTRKDLGGDAIMPPLLFKTRHNITADLGKTPPLFTLEPIARREREGGFQQAR